MSKNLYIDASHPNETRVVLKNNNHIEDYEYESINNTLIKNNIYLGKVSRIEPSLQAAFVDFGRDKHGFLSFNDIQSDYYQIPKSDLEIIKQQEEEAREKLSKEVEAKEEKNLAEGKLEIDDPLEIKKELEDKKEDEKDDGKLPANDVAAMKKRAAAADQGSGLTDEEWDKLLKYHERKAFNLEKEVQESNCLPRARAR